MVGLKCVLYPEWIDFEKVCLCITTVYRYLASVFEISAVNLIVGWCEFACVMNLSISGMLLSHNEKNVVCVSFPSHWLYDAFAKNLCVSISAIKIFANATAILVRMAVP